VQILTNPQFEFINRRVPAYLVSILAIAAGIGSLVTHGGPRYSIDFRGGSILQMRFAETVPIEEIRGALAGVGLSDAEIQRYGEPNEILIRASRGNLEETLLEKTLKERWPDSEVRRKETVGPKVGSELRSAATQAIILSLIGILIYVAVRFQFRFAVAAIVALVHDVLVTLGALSIANREISLAVIAAFLTIVGWSINDTIVLFDRIRENLRVPTREKYDRILNASVNQCLSRTFITAGTVFVVVVVLLAFGGEVLRDFSFAMTVGVIAGTYSSVYIATALLADWENLRPRRSRK
jgi:preprotein translocase SecF subunit